MFMVLRHLSVWRPIGLTSAMRVQNMAVWNRAARLLLLATFSRTDSSEQPHTPHCTPLGPGGNTHAEWMTIRWTVVEEIKARPSNYSLMHWLSLNDSWNKVECHCSIVWMPLESYEILPRRLRLPTRAADPMFHSDTQTHFQNIKVLIWELNRLSCVL
jgi:hypothetical protein